MPRGYKQCGICKGTGKVTESSDYEFLMRDPITSRCLNCDGSGLVHSRSGVNRKALAKAKMGFPQITQMNAQTTRIEEAGDLVSEKAEKTEGVSMKARESKDQGNRQDVAKTIEVTITCRLTYEQLAQVMKYNEVSHKGEK